METETPKINQYEIKVRPTPFNEVLILEAKAKKPMEFLLFVTDSENRVVKSGYWVLSEHVHTSMLRDWPAGPGIYTLKILDTTNWQTVETRKLTRNAA